MAAAGAPLLVVPALRVGDAIDDTSIGFLLDERGGEEEGGEEAGGGEEGAEGLVLLRTLHVLPREEEEKAPEVWEPTSSSFCALPGSTVDTCFWIAFSYLPRDGELGS